MNTDYARKLWDGVPSSSPQNRAQDLKTGDTVTKYGHDVGRIVADAGKEAPLRTYTIR